MLILQRENGLEPLSWCSRRATTRLVPMRSIVAASLALALTGSAHADFSRWLTAVGQGELPEWTGLNFTQPDVVDIGTINGTQTATYEFVVNGTLDGLSSALMGIKFSGQGDNCALKFEQYADTGRYGVTLGGVADHVGPFGMYSQDVHLAWVVDHTANTCELFENGVSVHVFDYAPHLTGMVGIGQWYDASSAANHVDALTGTILGVAAYDTALTPAEIQIHANEYFSPIGIGATYCTPQVVNSTGVAATLTAFGSANVADNQLMLQVRDLPPNVFGMCLVGASQASVPMAGGSQGTLCIGSPLHQMTSQVRFSGPTGAFDVPFDTVGTTLPGGQSLIPGMTWFFQAWYRDQNPAHATNFSDAYYVLFM